MNWQWLSKQNAFSQGAVDGSLFNSLVEHFVFIIIESAFGPVELKVKVEFALLAKRLTVIGLTCRILVAIVIIGLRLPFLEILVINQNQAPHVGQTLLNLIGSLKDFF